MPISMPFFAIKNIEEIDFPKLIRQLPNRPLWDIGSVQAQYVKAFLQSYDTLKANDINTAKRLAHFIGQGLVETGFLRARSENLNYRPEQLRKVFGRYFTADEIPRFAGQPEKIANRVYANRMGNGPEESGDGWRYRGRGFFQLTGKDNYRRFGEMAGVDLVSDPDLIARDLKASILVAAAFFNKAGLGAYADQDNVAAVSRGINLGNARSRTPAHGEAERVEWTARALALVRDPTSIVLPGRNQDAAPGPGPQSPSDVLKIGSTGDAVKRLQQDLAALGYAGAGEDGVYGPGTSRAVLAFQHERGLPATGEADAATRAALEAALSPAPQDPTAPPQEAPPPRPPFNDKPEKPLAQSRTIWGAVLAGLAAGVEFLRAQVAQVAALFPVIETPLGPFNTVWILAAIVAIGIAVVIFARIDDRNKKRR